MKVSLNWIKEFTSIDGSIGELVELIGSRLVEVEELIDWGTRFQGVVVGEILHVEEHSNADKLNVYKVRIGESEERQVVSGDKTLQVGDRVGYIGPGVTVPSTYGAKDPAIMEERPLRGVMSQGMFGSPQELCLSADHNTVATLDRDIAAGTPLAEAYNLDDVIIDIDNKSFTHRPDCFGIIGLSREIAAIQGKSFKSPSWFASQAFGTTTSAGGKLPLTVKNELPDLCSRYMAVAIADVHNGQSPWQLQSMLTRMGIRPVSLVVDITNYLMLLTGQPLHAFDYDKVVALSSDGKTAEITVRHPKEDEQLSLLDGRVITPRKGAVLIAAEKEPIALAGAMGGASTEVDAHTKNIIIESANFDMYNIRSTSMEHGVFTDAVTRFGKGQSPTLCAPVLNHALGMVLEYCADAQIASDVADDYPKQKRQEEIRLGAHWINDLLGVQLETDQMASMLKNIECGVAVHGSELVVLPPHWRSDITIAEDVVDEIGRLYGFDNIAATIVNRKAIPIMPSGVEVLESKLRDVLSSAGANEVLTYDFVSAKLMQQSNQEVADAFHLSNSISPELAYLRMTLLPSLLSKVFMNHKAGFGSFALFEMGKTHNKQEIGPDELPLERKSLAMVWSAADNSYDLGVSGAAFYQIKHYVNVVAEKIGIAPLEFRLLRSHTVDSIPAWLRNRVGLFDLNRSAIVVHDDKILGIVGEPNAVIRKALKLPKAIGMAEFGLGELLAAHTTKPAYTPLIPYPAIEQDICFRLAMNVHYQDVELYVNDFLQATDLHGEVSPVDIYARTGQDEFKHVTIRIRLQHPERTLTTKEVNDLMDKLADKVHQVLRGERV